jgi:hypothetical protein
MEQYFSKACYVKECYLLNNMVFYVYEYSCHLIFKLPQLLEQSFNSFFRCMKWNFLNFHHKEKNVNFIAY